MNIYIYLSYDKYIDKYYTLSLELKKIYKNCVINIFIDELDYLSYEDLKHDKFSSIDNLISINAYNQNLSIEESKKIIYENDLIVPSNLYNSDLRFHAKILNKDELIVKQAKMIKIFKDNLVNENSISFCKSGTNLVHSVLFKISDSLNICTYRIHNFVTFEIGFKLPRIWFSPNDIRKIENNKFNFDHDEKILKKKSEDWIDSINQKKYHRHILNRKNISRRYPNTFNTIVKEFSKYIYLKSTFNKKNKYYQERIKNLINSFKGKSLYTKLEDIENNILLFALNVPTDSQILVRTSYYSDFMALISIVANCLPENYTLVIREHPAYPGMLNRKELSLLLKKYKNVKFVSEKYSFFQMINKSKSVLIINNTSYFESILLGKPVIALGKGLFSGQNIVNEVNSFDKLYDTIVNPTIKPNKELLSNVLTSVYKETYPNYEDKSNKTKIDLTIEGVMVKIKTHFKALI